MGENEEETCESHPLKSFGEFNILPNVPMWVVALINQDGELGERPTASIHNCDLSVLLYPTMH